MPALSQPIMLRKLKVNSTIRPNMFSPFLLTFTKYRVHRH